MSDSVHSTGIKLLEVPVHLTRIELTVQSIQPTGVNLLALPTHICWHLESRSIS